MTSEPIDSSTYDSSADRLRAACLVGGVSLLAFPLLPFEAVDDRPTFAWEILEELHPITALATLAPALCGLVLLVASRRLRRPSLLAQLTVLVLATWSLLAKLGADAAAWELAALPDSLNRRLELYVIGIACSGAALRLLAEPVARRAARIVAALAVVFGLSFGLWPGEGEAPLQTCLRFVASLASLPDPRLVIGYGLVLTIGLFPLLAASVALSLALTGRSRHTALIAELATFGAPGLVFGLALQRVLATFGDNVVIVTSARALMLAALLALLARSFEQLALWATGLGETSEKEQSPRPQRFVTVAAAFSLVTLVAAAVLARPVAKGIAWPLGARTESADRVFGELLPKWALSRARWSVVAGGSASAADLAEARAAGNELLGAARALNPELGRAVTELVSGASELDLAGRRWLRLVESVNEASRVQKLPYYLDPNVRVGTHEGRRERLFLLYPYRVEAVQAVRADGADYALLGVRRLGAAREGHARLGFSRDRQPFALVVLDEVEPYATSLAEQSRREPPSCSDASLQAELGRCGAVLRQLAPSVQQVRWLVERHELQHQIDGPHLAHSPVVLEALGGYSVAAIDEVNRELSAYLSELATPRVSPKLALVHVMPFATSRPGSALRFVVNLELKALARLSSADERSLPAIFDELTALPDEALRQRAREAYERLFDAELPDVTH